DDSREHAQVRERHGGKDDRRLGAHPPRDLLFQLDLDSTTGEGARSAKLGAPVPGSASESGLHARILIQTEKAIEPEIHEVVTADEHLAVRADFFDIQLFEMGVGELFRGPSEEAHHIARTN